MKTNEQPPFQPKQFVRIKASGTILNVARCEKRVVHGALRWVVDDLNGMRAFAADCELIKNMELVNAETGEAVIHLEPQPVRYACTKLAAVGDIVKYAGVVDSVRLRVRDVQPDGIIKGESLDGKVKTTCRAEKLEYVPECAESDHIVDANKMVEPAASDSVLGVRHWLDARRGVEVVSKSDYDAVAASRDEWERECDSQRRAIREGLAACQSMGEQLAVAKLLLGQCDNRLFLVGDFEIRKAGGGWHIYCPPSKLALSADDVFEIFRDPVAAALRAKELSGVAKGGAA